jgi:hypothetical protein
MTVFARADTGPTANLCESARHFTFRCASVWSRYVDLLGTARSVLAKRER